LKGVAALKLVIFGLSITSAWGNGHATTFRALARALHARGHRIVFFERDQEWYASNRDLPEPEFCDVRIFDDWRQSLPLIRSELAECDVAMVGSYFLDGIQATQELVDCDVPVKAFYDIDTPITVAQLRRGGAAYIRADQVPIFDLYFSFTGGPLLSELETCFGARRAVPLYCSFDPLQYHPRGSFRRYACDLSYMGTYAPDRQPKLEQLFCDPARELPELKFLLAGSQYPPRTRWPKNVRRVTHLSPRWHGHLYSSSRLVLNLTRHEMVSAGYSPSVRLFEAAACGATIVSDKWSGIESFFVPGKEILLADQARDVIGYLRDADPLQLAAIGQQARLRVLAEHTSHRRAEQFEAYVSEAASNTAVSTHLPALGATVLSTT
jgi:spore maturation protein CgeB